MLTKGQLKLSSEELNFRLRPYLSAIDHLPEIVWKEANRESLNRYQQIDDSQKALKANILGDTFLNACFKQLQERYASSTFSDRNSFHRDCNDLIENFRSQVVQGARINQEGYGPNSFDVFSSNGFIWFDETLESVQENYFKTLKKYGLSKEDFSRSLELLIHPMTFALTTSFVGDRYDSWNPLIKIDGIEVFPWGSGSAGTQYCPFGDNYYGSDWESKIVFDKSSSVVTQLHPHLVKEHNFPEGNCPSGRKFNLDFLCELFVKKDIPNWGVKSVDLDFLTYAREGTYIPEYSREGLDFYEPWRGKGNNYPLLEAIKDGFSEWVVEEGLYFSRNKKDPSVILVSESPSVPSKEELELDSILKKPLLKRKSFLGLPMYAGGVKFYEGSFVEVEFPIPGVFQEIKRKIIYPDKIDLFDKSTYLLQNPADFDKD